MIQSDLNVNSANATQFQQNGYDLLPKGAIIIWTQYTIPKGWTLCDGTKGTPNLKGRFVVGVGKRNKNISDQDDYYNETPSYSLDSKGGTEKIKLEKIPPHRHSYKNNESPITQKEEISTNEKDANAALGDISTTLDQTQDVYGGPGQPHTNLPPYFALYYIMKL
jgi:microcystin-dependent protein